MINALVTVQIHRQSFYHPNSPCAFIQNSLLSHDASIQSCIWECQYKDDCQTAVYYHDNKTCSMFAELCTTGRIESSGNVRSSVICHRKNREPVITCSSTSTVNQRPEEETSTSTVSQRPEEETSTSTVSQRPEEETSTSTTSQRPEEETSTSHMITSTATVTTTVPTTTTSNITVLNVNLVINGDAETGPCATVADITHPTDWNYNGTITQVAYNVTFGSILSFTDPGPNDRGKCCFFGYNSSNTFMWQTINLTNPADHLLIDNQTVKFNLSAWIGGYGNQNDNAAVSLTFINQSNQILNNRTTIGPVLASDRGGTSELLFRNATGLVPIGTRFLTISVEITRDSGTWNNGYVDNIAVILHQ